MFRFILLLTFFTVQTPILFAQPDSQNLSVQEQQQLKEDELAMQAQNVQPQSTEQRLFEIERSIRNLQRQIDRLSSTVDQQKTDFGYTSQSVNNLKRSVDSLENNVDDLKSEQRDIARQLGR